jgi:hypothetical protein
MQRRTVSNRTLYIFLAVVGGGWRWFGLYIFGCDKVVFLAWVLYFGKFFQIGVFWPGELRKYGQGT